MKFIEIPQFDDILKVSRAFLLIFGKNYSGHRLANHKPFARLPKISCFCGQLWPLDGLSSDIVSLKKAEIEFSFNRAIDFLMIFHFSISMR